jgi:hypothetical protein
MRWSGPSLNLFQSATEAVRPIVHYVQQAAHYNSLGPILKTVWPEKLKNLIFLAQKHNSARWPTWRM